MVDFVGSNLQGDLGVALRGGVHDGISVRSE